MGSLGPIGSLWGFLGSPPSLRGSLWGSPPPFNPPPPPQAEGEEPGGEKAPKAAPEEEEEEKGRKEEDGQKEAKKVSHAPLRQATPPSNRLHPLQHIESPRLLGIDSTPFSEAPPLARHHPDLGHAHFCMPRPPLN